MASHSSGLDGGNNLGSRAQTSSRSGVFRHLEREGSWEIWPGISRERTHGTFRGRARGGSWNGKQGRSRDKYHGESYNRTQKEPSKRGQRGSWNKPGSTVSRGNGNTNNRHHPSTKFHSIQSLQRIMEKPPDELVLYMTNERWLPATESLLNQKEMKDDMIVQLLKVLAHACDSGTAHARLTNLLSRLPTSMYFSYHLSNYIMRWGDSIHSEEREKELICMSKIFSELLNKQPSCYPHLPLAQLSYTTKILADKALLCNEAIQSDVEDLMTLKNEMAEKVKKEVEEMGKNPKRQKRINEAALRDAEAPPDDFRALSITPTIQDVHNRGTVFLRRNKISGRYNDNEHYLDVQFRLLREDFIRPLREGIQELLERMESANFKFLQDIRVYSGVRILYPIFTIKGLTHKIQFDVSKLKRVRWENSKRLIYGSLLCLSKDNFETFLLATVETREEEELKQGMLEVRLTDLSPRIDLGGVEYQMVETTAYFESYRHVLEGLKEIDPENLPFQRYIVECDNDIQPPEYLRNRMREEVTYDLSPIMTKKAKRNLCLLGKIQSQDENKNREQIQIQGQDQDQFQDQCEDQDQFQDQYEDEDQAQCHNQYEDEDQDQFQDQCEDQDQDQFQDQYEDEDQVQWQDQCEDQDQDQFQDQYEDQDQAQFQDHEDQDQAQCQDQYEDQDQDQSKDLDQTQEQRREYIRKRSGKSVRILDMDSWPSAEDLGLDDSQLKAVQLALTKEFAIIQGPPGTGKTYIGLKVAKVLLHNKSQWERGTEILDGGYGGRQVANNMPARPILVVCYTNHALDQFLEGIFMFHKKGIVRVGGRCQSEKLKSFTLQEIKHQMRKERNVPADLWFAIQEAYQKLELSSNELKSATQNLQICKENIIHEEELQEKGIMSQEQFESMICPYKDPYSNSKRSKRNPLIVHSAMLFWLNLVPDPSTMQNKAGPNAKLVAQFSFDVASNLTNRVHPSHKAVANRVKFMPGLHGKRDSSLELDGSPHSNIIIPNHEMNFLDTRWSMTILMYVYPMGGRGGPILSFYHQQTGFIGIQITQKGVQKGNGVISVSFNSRDGALFAPLNKAVLNMKQWNFIAASYDHHTGFMRLWHDGKMVEERQNPRMEIASHFPVFIGSLNLPKRRQSCFEGRVSFLEVYAEALRTEQIMAIAGIQEEDLLTEDQKQDTDILMEAEAIEKQRRLDDEHSFRMNPNEKESQVETLKIADQFDKQAGSQARFTLNFTKSQKLWIKEAIKKELSNRDMMQIPEGRSVKNVWKLTIRDRWRLYRRWITHLSSRYKNAVTRHQNDFEERAQELKEVHNLEDLKILEEATVIGMTTTGAAKYRHLIQRIKPRITIVEEAAEVLESHIVTSLSPGCQHLILIGDHQQLRPNANVYRLATDYNLDVSLFERMVHNGMKIERLRAQHRMRPEIARLINPIYHDLENHESVLKYENIKGVNSNIFFIEHNELEELIEEGMSRTNIHEAKYLAALCRYFILQGYNRQQITILTMYTGQLNQLKKEMPKEFFLGVRICAVDNFQGEENDIILLSLVRSNEEGKIGFLRISNRVCVALSRAKKGFYCIGNLELMCEQKGSLWDKIIDDMRNEGKVGPYLTLMCQNHPKTIIHASKPNDFRKAPQGGCMEPCKARLDCGHVCTLLCHPADSEHTEYKCKEKCLKSCDRGHKCKQLCYEECNPCRVLVSKKIPSCGHDQKVPCSMDPKDFDCRAPCERFCDSGHKCKQLCYEECKPCRVLVPKKIPSCGHDQEVPCHMKPKDFNCKAPCERSCDNGHQCEKLCYKKCGPCLFLMQKKLPSCGHDQEVPCHMKPKDFNCKAPCERTCDQGHNDCKMLCHQECNPCNVFILKKIPSCGHDQKVPCHMDPQDFKCQARCPKNLPCNHPCQNKCFEPCITKCRQETTKQLLCGHEKEVQCHMNPKDATCSAVCKVLLKCNHSCKGNCSQCLRGRLHKPCQEKCDRTLFCGHSCQDKCANNCPPCPKNCENKCTHKICKKKCGEPCTPCRKPCNWKCQHFKCTKLCSEPCDRPRCDKPCKKKPFKKCRHRCIGMCGEPCPKKCRECDKEEVTQHLFGDEHNPNARFVEVQPCGHVIEVRAMDNWVDEGTSDTSNLGIIRCPRCKAPIRTSARYGNIIKTTLIDLEKIKAKTFLGRKDLIKHSVQLKQIISNQLHTAFPEEAEHFKKTLERKDIKSEQLSCCEKQIYVMNCLSKLCIGGKQKGRKELPKTRSTHREVIKNIKDDVSSLVSRVMVKGRQHFSDQEMDEISNEMKRVFLMYLYEFQRRTSRHEDGTPSSLDLGALKQAIESGTPIDEATHNLHIKELTKLQTLLDIPLCEDPLKIQNENELVKVIYLTQDHWSKCPEGHVYYIDECDVVVSEGGFCTECKSIRSKVVESSSK